MRIRHANLSDAFHICEIYNPFVRESIASFEKTEISAEQMAARIASIAEIGLPFLVADIDGGIAGYAYGSRWKSRAGYRYTVEVSVYVAPSYQGLGVARKLYTELFSSLREMNLHAVIGVITLPNEASVNLHESFGLEKVAHFSEVGRKFGQWIDVGYWQGFLGNTRVPLPMDNIPEQ